MQLLLFVVKSKALLEFKKFANKNTGSSVVSLLCMYVNNANVVGDEKQ